MADPKSILDALQALKAATDIVKALRGADVSFEKAELKLKVAELAESLANARIAVLDAQDEIRMLQERIKELEAAEDVSRRLVLRENVYFLADDEEKRPYCPRCFEVDSSLIPVAKLSSVFHEMGKYKCPNCKAVY